MSIYFNGDYASSRGFEASLIKSFSHKFSAEVNYTFSASPPASRRIRTQALQFFNGGRLYLPISEQPLNWDQRHTLSVSSTVRDPGKWGFRYAVELRLGLPVHARVPQRPRAPIPSSTTRAGCRRTRALTIDGDKYYKIWGQNVTLFFDARNVLSQPNIASLSLPAFPNPYINTAGDDYAIYYTGDGTRGRRVPAGRQWRQLARLGARQRSTGVRRRAQCSARRQRDLLTGECP